MIYAISDIHGCLDAFDQALSVVDFSDPETKLVLLGDYIDHDHARPEAFRAIMELQQEHPDQVIALAGNHELMFLEERGVPVEEGPFGGLDDASFEENRGFDGADAEDGGLFDFSMLLVPVEQPTDFKDEEVIAWLRSLPLFYETEDQIFVHAGVDEEAGETWALGTDANLLTGKFPPTQGAFHKDIVAGHTGTCSYHLANDPDFHDVFWDGQSHYHIDGSTEFSGVIPVLRFDPRARKYASCMPPSMDWRPVVPDPSVW